MEPDSKARGVLVSEAMIRLPSVLKEYDENLAYRHLPFREVTLGLFGEVVETAIQNGCVIGVGYDHAKLEGKQDEHRHLARIVANRGHDEIQLADDYVGRPAPLITVNWAELESAVYRVDDGFWIIGHRDAIQLDYVPFSH